MNAVEPPGGCPGRTRVSAVPSRYAVYFIPKRSRMTGESIS